jgi:hypothetical protein
VLELTTAFQVAAAEDMAAACKVQVCDYPIFGVNAIRKALRRFFVVFVHVGEGVATDGASVDEIEGRSFFARWHGN